MDNADAMRVLKRFRCLDAPFGYLSEIGTVVWGTLSCGCRHGDRRGHQSSFAVGCRLGHGQIATARALLFDQAGKRLTVNKLHGVVVDAAFAADRVYGHDMRVLQGCRSSSLV